MLVVDIMHKFKLRIYAVSPSGNLVTQLVEW